MKMESIRSFAIASPRDALETLSRNLRRLPDGFVWGFDDCRTCAMGLAEKLGLAKGRSESAMMAAFDLSRTEAVEIFSAGYRYWRGSGAVDVADRIDELLQRRRT